MRTVYRILFLFVIFPMALVRLLVRSKKAPAYRARIAERLGWVKEPGPSGGLWVHAVSVGEVLAAVPIVKALLDSHPQLTVMITTMTPTGSERVTSIFQQEMGSRVFHTYCPYDIPWLIQRFLHSVQPKALIVMETELWPELIHQTSKRNIPVIVANARLSKRSAKGYRRFYSFVKNMLRQDISMLAVQSESDKRRFKALGVPAERCQVTGTVKYDIQVPQSVLNQAATLKDEWAGRRVWIAASTHQGEDLPLLEVHKHLRNRLGDDVLLVLVPRHPERFNEVAALIESQGFLCQRRSSTAQADVLSPEVGVYLGDTMGELLMLYGTADVAFVGGSIVETGGHNPLEPVALDVPVVVGPYMFNFAEVHKQLLRAKGILQVGLCSDDDVQKELTACIEALFTDESKRRVQIEGARDVMSRNKGALSRLMALLDEDLSS